VKILHALHYANELLVRVRLFFTFLFVNICKLANRNQTTMKKCSGKSNDAYSLSIRVQTSIIYISICFLPQYRRQRILFRARAKKGIARHIDVSSVARTLIENGKLVNQIARLAEIVVKLKTPLLRYFYNHLNNYTKTIIRLSS